MPAGILYRITENDPAVEIGFSGVDNRGGKKVIGYRSINIHCPLLAGNGGPECSKQSQVRFCE
jgi:hypothetical protein